VDLSDSVDPVALAAVPVDPVDPVALAVLAVDPVDLVADHAVLAVDLAVGLVDLAAVPVGPSAGVEHPQPCEMPSPIKPH